MLIVLPWCAKDEKLLVQSLAWMAQMGGAQRHECLLTFDDTTEPQAVEPLAKTVFGKVSSFRYPHPQGETKWPFPQNWSWQFIARHIGETRKEPWFWLEADAVPLKPDWADQIEAEYKKAGKPFMGTLCSPEGYDPYLNGVAVYPHNVADYCIPAFLCRQFPWDMTMGKFIVPEKSHDASHLIQHIRSEKGFSFRTFSEAGNLIKPTAVIFHKCKDGSLIDVLGLKRHEVELPHQPIKRVVNRVTRQIRGLLSGGSSYYHSGNLGDLAYALYAIKANGGGDLLIGPQQYHTSPCALPIDAMQFQRLVPFLRSQPYLKRIEFREAYPVGEFRHDLNRFRNHWNNWGLRQRERIDTLVKAHFYTLGITHRFDPTVPWLEMVEPINTGRIVIHRSFRYRNPAFPWRRLVRDFGWKMLFVGLEEEHNVFEKEMEHRVSFWKVKDFLELAQLIAGADSCICNQSFPLSLALGFGKDVTVEEWEHSPDCRLQRDNYRTA